MLVFAYLLSGDWLGQVHTLSPHIFIVFIGIVSLAYAVRAWRWCFLTRRLRLQVPAATAAQIYIGGFPMALSPGRVGELWRAWVLNTHWQIPYKKGIFITFFDRWLDLNILLLFAAVGFAAADSYAITATIATAGIAAVCIIVLLPAPITHMFRATARAHRHRPRLRKTALTLCIICQQIHRQTHAAIYLPALALSLLAWCIEAAALVYAAAQLHATLTATAAAATIGTANIAGVITLLPAGVGGQELTMHYLLEQLGNAPAVSLTLIAVFRLGTTYYGTLLGLPLFFLMLKKSL